MAPNSVIRQTCFWHNTSRYMASGNLYCYPSENGKPRKIAASRKEFAVVLKLVVAQLNNVRRFDLFELQNICLYACNKVESKYAHTGLAYNDLIGDVAAW